MLENVYNETKYIMDKYHIVANKSLGQNFLIDDEVINKIVETASVSKEDLIIEIGPGLGTLTSRILEKAGKVIAIELDKKMVTILEDRFSLYNYFEIINEDILKVELNKLIEENTKLDYIKNVKVVANLPYYITTPIIMKLVEDKLDIESITVMVQKEVAKRLTAEPGTQLSGAITYTVNYYCIPQEIIVVPNSSFIPAPDVESEVIKLTIRKEPPVNVENVENFFKLIKVSFMQRRKTLINGVANSNFMGKENFKNILGKLGIDEKIRGEDLTLDDFAKISNECIKIVEKQK